MPGATIGVAAVSGPADPQKLEAGISALRARGYRVLEAPNLRRRCGYLAGTDEERAGGYRALVRDPAVDAIFFARGGYGASRVLSRLDPGELSERPKIHMGGSDLTALFAWAGLHSGLVTFYGPMVALEIASGTPLDWEGVLSGDVPAAHEFSAGDVLAPGTAKGPLVGGCLSLLASLVGTPEAVSPRGAVLFWEDVGEEIYRLDRLLTQLERSGTFDDLRGMVIGSVTPVRAESAGAIRDFLRERFAGAPFPVGAGLCAGHLASPRSLPLGIEVTLDLAERGTLSFSGPAVA
jgi:muramoyltetrapeptide carboxypeptidase